MMRNCFEINQHGTQVLPQASRWFKKCEDMASMRLQEFPKDSHHGPNRSQDGSNGAQHDPKKGQDGSKRTKVAPRWSKGISKKGLWCSKGCPWAPRGLQGGLWEGQGPRRHQDGIPWSTKMAQRRLQRRPGKRYTRTKKTFKKVLGLLCLRGCPPRGLTWSNMGGCPVIWEPLGMAELEARWLPSGWQVV